MNMSPIAIDDIDSLPTAGVSWELEGADATYAGKVLVIIIVVVILF